MGNGRVAIPIRPNFKSTKPTIDKECLDIIAWLSPLDFWKKQNDVFVKHQEGTGKWMLDSKEFNDWLLGSGMTLWCPGIRMIILDNLRRMCALTDRGQLVPARRYLRIVSSLYLRNKD
jgi:hypothetical protein